ncbi:MAG TPA: hypothetical protein VFC13_27815 [Actinomycetes bacterium]|nr:hypothetical protein [Actinomycetes bacterium]
MAEEQTCGWGLAEHAALPAKLAEVTEATADNLQLHMAALQLDDPAARMEHGLYLRLVEEQRQAAARLRLVGEEMAGARDLPMGAHDEQALASPAVAEAFRRFVRVRQELVGVLQAQLDQDQRLLAELDAPDAGP